MYDQTNPKWGDQPYIWDDSWGSNWVLHEHPGVRGLFTGDFVTSCFVLITADSDYFSLEFYEGSNVLFIQYVLEDETFYAGVEQYVSDAYEYYDHSYLLTVGWHHICASRSGDALRIFVDGVPIVTFNTPSLPPDPYAPVTIQIYTRSVGLCDFYASSYATPIVNSFVVPTTPLCDMDSEGEEEVVAFWQDFDNTHEVLI